MPLTGFRQALSGVCKSLASLSLWQRPSAAALPVTSPLPCRSNRTDRTNRLRIGTFNVQSLGSLYKQFETLPQDLRRYQIDILGLQETKLYELGRYEVGDYLLLTLPAQEERYGVGFAISPRVTPYLRRCWAHSDRIGILQMRLPHTGTINIVTAYAPHSGRPLAEVDTFYADLRAAMDQFPRRDITMLVGDFNAKLGQKTTGETFLGPHARGTRNRNGHLMAAFCDTYQLFATNTAFPKRAKNKITGSQRQRTHCVYNQIDYVLCPQNCRRFCLDAQSWGGALTPSDHKIVTADFELKHSHRLRFPSRRTSGTTVHLARSELVHNDDSRTTYASAVKRALPPADADDGSTVTQQWEDTLAKIHEAASQTIGFTSPDQRRGRRYKDQLLTALSEQQRQLGLRIYNDISANPALLRSQRNKILHQIRTRCCDLANTAIDEKVSRIEASSDSHKMFVAVRELARKPTQQLLIQDSSGKYILHRHTANNIVRDHFQEQFLNPDQAQVTPDPTARPLDCPITPDEVRSALRRLNNGRAAGPDTIPGELLKFAAAEVAPRLAHLLNRSFERGEPITLGHGILLCLQKPNKPRGQCSSLRPIVLLNTIRKAVSLIVLRRIAPAVDKFLSSHQSGFRKSRSTADAVWAHKWLCARVQKYREIIHVLGIDFSRAFDTIDRAKLLEVLHQFLHDDDIRLIRLLLSDTTLSLRIGHHILQPFGSNTGTPQGDSLSPVLFVIYLEAALRDLASHPAMPPDLLQQMIVYADDADFICRDPALVELLQTHAPEVFARWSLQMNAAKTEHTILRRCLTPASEDPHARADEEAWRSTRKLGSLLGDADDISRRKLLAAAALRRLWTVWLRSHRITDKTRIRLYNCYVLPIVLYNCGTWALTPTELHRLESFHRRQLRSVLRMRYPCHISNADLYATCDERPLRHRITSARWGLLGHILRRPQDIPAFIQMKAYFSSSDSSQWRGRPRTTLPIVLDQDLVASGCGHRLRTSSDLERLRLLAQDRRKWKTLMTTIAESLPAKGDSTYADTTLCRRLAKLRLAQV